MHPLQKEQGIEMALLSPAGLICDKGGKNYNGVGSMSSLA